jgi:hypothetical protein
MSDKFDRTRHRVDAEERATRRVGEPPTCLAAKLGEKARKKAEEATDAPAENATDAPAKDDHRGMRHRLPLLPRPDN